MEENREPRNQPTLWSINLQQQQKKKTRIHSGEKTVSSINGAGETGHPVDKNLKEI